MDGLTVQELESHWATHRLNKSCPPPAETSSSSQSEAEEEWPPGLVGLGQQFQGMDGQEFKLGLNMAVWMAKHSDDAELRATLARGIQIAEMMHPGIVATTLDIESQDVTPRSKSMVDRWEVASPHDKVSNPQIHDHAIPQCHDDYSF
eukprot:SAG31_NODE_13592_length_859_cov_0.859211_1_plen_148_part_00